WMRPAPGKSLALNIPRAALAPLVPNFEDALMRPIAHDSEALRLLTSYLGVLHGGSAVATPALRQIVATHIHDLMALAIGATRDAEALAAGRGGRAARLRAIKVDIVQHLSRGDLS